MDQETKNVVDMLNSDLFGEHEAIVYYLTHAWTVARQYGREVLEIAYDEMRHFKWLGHTIAQLGGVPDLTTPEIGPVSTIQSALQKDIEVETQAIEQYEKHIDVIPQDSIKALLRRINADEFDHLRQFREMLDQSHGEPHSIERPDDEVHHIANTLQASVGIEYQQMMAYLMRSFMEDHGRQMGLDMEERSIDEMRHMGWIGKRMGQMGLQAQFPQVDSDDIVEGEHREESVYRDVRQWAKESMPTLVPTIDRILAHEDYHINTHSVGSSAGTV